MDSNKRIIFILLAIILVLVGGIGGYMGHQYFHMGEEQDKVSNVSTMPNGQKDVPLTKARDTAIVQAVKKASPSVVGITTKSYSLDAYTGNVQVSEGVGSGVIIDSKGYIVTNNHVIANAQNGTVVVSFPDGKSVEGKVVGADAMTDLAVVKVDTNKPLPAATLGDSDQLQVGEPAIAIGNPLGLEFQGTVTAGVISALHRSISVETQQFPLIQTDAAINPGNSGGALVNADGEVIGINSAKIAKEGIEGIGFSIPINEVKTITEELIKNGKVSRPYLGVVAIDKEIASKYGLRVSADGLTIVQIDPNGPAYGEGMRQGDVITAIDGNNVHSLAELRKAIAQYKVGQSVEVSVVRGNNPITFQVKLGVLQN